MAHPDRELPVGLDPEERPGADAPPKEAPGAVPAPKRFQAGAGGFMPTDNDAPHTGIG